MSQREGHAMGEAATPPRPADSPASAVARVQDATDALPICPTSGSLRPTESNARPGQLASDRVATFVQRLSIEPLPCLPLVNQLKAYDAALDDRQRDAVARAIEAPDLFVISGPTGTGKSRLTVEIVRHLVQRGERVLWLSSQPQSLDRFLGPAARDLAIVRRLGPGEKAEALPDDIAALTVAARRQQQRHALRAAAQQALAESEQRCRRAELLARSFADWTQLHKRLDAVQRERTGLLARRQLLDDEVAGAAASADGPAPFFIQRLRGVAATHDKRLTALAVTAAELQSVRATVQQELSGCEVDLARLRPKAEAIEHKRWYTLTYWRARSDAGLAERLAELHTRRGDLAADLHDRTLRAETLAAERRQLEAEYQAERTRLLESENKRRAAEIDARLVELASTVAEGEAHGNLLREGFRTQGFDPAQGGALGDERAAAQKRLDAARQRVSDVEARLDELVEQESAPCAVVAGPLAGVTHDATTQALGPFDRLVIDDAQRLTEAEFVGAAGLARRWIVVGDMAVASGSRGRGAQPDFLARLRALLHHEVWVRDAARLTCRLYPVVGGQRRRLECEPVADAPDIELRLYTPLGGEPTLAEVAFPMATSPPTAREFVFRELGEVTCQPRCRSALWESTPAGVVARFGRTDPLATRAVIGPGVSEELTGLETRAVHFSGAWTLERAQEWVAQHVGRRDSGRLALLEVPYRACPGLAHWLNRAFALGFAEAAPGTDVPHVEFLAVPDTTPQRRRGQTGGRVGRIAGAGYEIDLGDPRQRAALPAEFRDLPTTGYINLHEAQALVRYLEALTHVTVAVTSPFATQLVVLRALLSRVPRLARIPVVDPVDAGSIEIDMLAISLTRSHVARAVTFGEAPAVMARLLGMARKKLLFAGDPGTLARRLQWEGPVDHLDAADAARECAWITALADCPRVTQSRSRFQAAGART